MKLFYTPIHAFIHKSLVVIAEKGLANQVTFVPTFPFRNADMEVTRGLYPMTDINPLGKVPTLTLDDGTPLYGSQTVVEYLDSLGSGPLLFPASAAQRWDALRRLALGDTVFELTVQMSMEGRTPDADPRPGLYDWLQPKIEAAFDVMNEDVQRNPGFDIGQVGFLQGISYAARNYAANSDDPLYPNFDWQKGRQALRDWFEETQQRPSVAAYLNKPYHGDTSPENFQKHRAEVLAARSS